MPVPSCLLQPSARAIWPMPLFCRATVTMPGPSRPCNCSVPLCPRHHARAYYQTLQPCDPWSGKAPHHQRYTMLSTSLPSPTHEGCNKRLRGLSLSRGQGREAQFIPPHHSCFCCLVRNATPTDVVVVVIVVVVLTTAGVVAISFLADYQSLVSHAALLCWLAQISM